MATVKPSGTNLPRLAGKTNREPRDTVDGCRARADQERSELAITTDGFMRRRLERSAAAWTARAEMLARDEAEYAKWRRTVRK